MNLYGLQKTTLLDYPGHLAATIFTGGCNMRCPFCHNKDLITVDNKQDEKLDCDELFSFLNKRKNILEGVCITGGEPTLQPDLIPFIRRIKEMGYLVKLDTNGLRPDILKQLAGEKLIDYIAVDIKSSKETYRLSSGLDNLDLTPIEETVSFLMEGIVDYEFRTTVVKELHTKEDFVSIGKWIAGCRAYFLQSFKDGSNVLTPGLHACTKEELEDFIAVLKPYIVNVHLRGVS